MKKFFLFTAMICFASIAFAQSDKYISAMKANIAQLDSVMVKGNAVELANSFERIGNAEKTQWLPFYYAGYCTVMNAYNEKDVAKKDAIADKAQQFINKADSILGKENSETDVIKSMIATAHMTVDPQNRYMTYGPQITEFLEKSKSLDPSNPRPVLVQAENTFYTPVQFGGGKDAAKSFFDQAKKLDDNFKPGTEISPDWGKNAINYFLSQYK
jgi:hypothetical protein